MTKAHAYLSINREDHNFIDAIGDELTKRLIDDPINLPAISNSLMILRSILASHFDHEESIMKEQKYPDCSKHKNSHDYIITLISSSISSLSQECQESPTELWLTLKKTLETHIKKYDDLLVLYLDTCP